MSVGTRAGDVGTRAQLLSVARRLFAERGFAATSTEEVVTQAGVTRGALYYDFRNRSAGPAEGGSRSAIRRRSSTNTVGPTTASSTSASESMTGASPT